MKKDQIKGRVKEATGKSKEVVGKVIGNKDLEIEGKTQKNVGKVQATYGDIKDKVEKEKNS